MVEVVVEADELAVHLRGWDRLFALARRFVVPVDAVSSVIARPRAGIPLGVRVGGAYVPRVIAAGRYRRWGGEWSFWCVHRARTVVVVELEGHKYSRLVLEVDEPEATAAVLASALTGR